MEPVEGAAMPISSLPSMENSTRTEPNCSPGNSGRIEPPADGPLANLSSFRQTASTNKRAAYSYAYRGDGDAFAQGVSQNLPRIRKQQLDPNARGSVPLIARNIEVYNALIKAREDHLTRFGDAVQAADKALTQLGEFLPRETSRKQELAKKGPGDPQSASKLAHIQARIDLAQERQLKWTQGKDVAKEMLNAIDHTPVIHPDHSPIKDLDPRDSKLYFLGHGFANAEILSTTTSLQDKYTLGDMARGLKEDGLHPDFESFRMTSCESADTERRLGFAEDPPGRTDSGVAPAQTFANELKRVGFTDPKVTGYQGLGSRFPNGHTAERGTADKSEVVRRSTVAKVFTSKS